jgi:predicted outer membrane protein
MGMGRLRSIPVAGCALLALGVTDLAAAAPPETEEVADPEDIDALIEIHKANQKAIALAQFARERASPAVRLYAARLIKDHEQADHKVLTLLRDRGKTEDDITLELYGERAIPGRPREPAADPQPSATFYTARGADFDEEYLRLCARENDDAVATAREARGRTRDGEVKAFLGRLLAQLERHGHEARHLLPGGRGRPQPLDERSRRPVR